MIRAKGQIGTYYLEVGSGNRASKVIYDRAFSTMITLTREEVDIPKLCQGVDVFIVSGITIALQEELQIIILDIMDIVKNIILWLPMILTIEQHY